MSPPQTPFTYTSPVLLPVLEDLRCREPIFHTAAFGTTAAQFEGAMAEDYWEVGASGRRYSREFVLETLRSAPPVLADAAGWRTEDHALRQLGPDTYLLTYVLRQGQRVTRRATIWQSSESGWKILYHQGTLVSPEGDDTA